VKASRVENVKAVGLPAFVMSNEKVVTENRTALCGEMSGNRAVSAIDAIGLQGLRPSVFVGHSDGDPG
jgi:hypothetical protein